MFALDEWCTRVYRVKRLVYEPSWAALIDVVARISRFVKYGNIEAVNYNLLVTKIILTC